MNSTTDRWLHRWMIDGWIYKCNDVQKVHRLGAEGMLMPRNN